MKNFSFKTNMNEIKALILRIIHYFHKKKIIHTDLQERDLMEHFFRYLTDNSRCYLEEFIMTNNFDEFVIYRSGKDSAEIITNIIYPSSTIETLNRIYNTTIVFSHTMPIECLKNLVIHGANPYNDERYIKRYYDNINLNPYFLNIECKQRVYYLYSKPLLCGKQKVSTRFTVLGNIDEFKRLEMFYQIFANLLLFGELSVDIKSFLFVMGITMKKFENEEDGTFYCCKSSRDAAMNMLLSYECFEHESKFIFLWRGVKEEVFFDNIFPVQNALLILLYILSRHPFETYIMSVDDILNSTLSKKFIEKLGGESALTSKSIFYSEHESLLKSALMNKKFKFEVLHQRIVMQCDTEEKE